MIPTTPKHDAVWRANWLLYLTLPPCTLICILITAGWAMPVPLLEPFHPARGLMTFDTALSFIVLTTAFWLLSLPATRGKRFTHLVTVALATAVCLMGSLGLLQYIVPSDTGLDWLLAPREAGAASAFPRMSVVTAVSLILLGAATALVDDRIARRAYPGQILAVVVGTIGFVSAAVHFFEISAQVLGQYQQMSLQAALIFIGLSVAYVSLRPHQGIMADFNSPFIGGVLARRLMPFALVLPMVIGCLLWVGESRQLYTAQVGVALLIISLSFVSSVLIWWTARALNIADRKRQQEEGRFTVAFESAPFGMLIVHPDGRIAQANPQAASMFGYTPDELRKLNVDDLTPRRYEGVHRGYRDAYRAAPEVRSMGPDREVYGRRKDGTEFPVEVGLSPMPLAGTPFVFAVVVDISVRKLIEQELDRHTREVERSNRELEQFAYVASHDLQEPLRMVGSYVQLLERRYANKLDDDAREFIGYAVEGANRMQQLINDLLMLSRVGRRGKEIVAMPAETAVSRALFNLKAAIDSSGAEIVLGEMPLVMGDETQLVQLFQNLIGNAIKFRGKVPPRVVIGAEQSGGEYVFYVQDNGIGIEQQYAERIFQVFQRLHNRREYEGTGIGLAVCRRIIERHGGRIWVESAPEGGAAFYFTLLAAPEKEPAHAAV